MFRKILVQLDPARPLERAPHLAKTLAERYDAELVALYIVDETISHRIGGDISRAVDMALSAVGEEVLEEFEEEVGPRVPFSKTIGYGETAEVIAKYVIKNNVDLVVTGGFHASVYQRIPFGSVVNEVIRRTPASVFLYRDSHADPLRKGTAVVPYDGSVHARRAVHQAGDFASHNGQSMHVVHVQTRASRVRSPQVMAEIDETLPKLRVPVSAHLLRRVFPFSRSHAILRHAKRVDAPLIMLSQKGRRTTFGGLSPIVEKLVVHTDRPLLVMHA